MNPASNLFLIGPTGAGKSTVGRRIARALALDFVDLDQLIEARSGVSIARIFETEGEAAFRRRESALLDECTQRAAVVLATGAGAVLDPDNQARLRERGFVVYLETPVALQLDRLAGARDRPLLAQGDRRARLEAMAEIRTPIYRGLADLRFATDRQAPGPTAERLLAALNQSWQRS